MKKTINNDNTKKIEAKKPIARPTMKKEIKKTDVKKPVKKVIRDKRIELRISEQELKKINSYAKKAKMTRSDYLRNKVLG